MEDVPQWMEEKRPHVSDAQVQRVRERLRKGMSRAAVKQCCAECRAALKALDEMLRDD